MTTLFTADLAERAASFDGRTLRPEQVERVRQCALDWIGVTVAGAQDPVGRALQAVAAAEAAGPHSTVIGTRLRTGPQSAALANGTASHAHDYDDISFWMHGHPSVVVASAVFALAEARRLSGAEVVAALAAGYEIGSRVGLAVGTGHYVAGWHSTGTIGTFGAAAGAGRALGLDADAMERALGLAATQAAGLKVSFGSMAKPLHGGRAAAAGVLAALLAEQGFTAPRGAIEAPQGFAVTQAPGFDPERPDVVMDGRLGLESISFKKHPACGATHATIDALQSAFADHDLAGDDVEHVRLRVTQYMLDICCIEDPETGTEGMFSVRHAGALVLAGRTTGLDGFTDDAVHDPAVVAARERLEVQPHPDRPSGVRTEVTIRLRSGDDLVYDLGERVPASDDELPRQWATLSAKFRDLVAPVAGEPAVDELVARIARFEDETDVVGLLQLTHPKEVDER
jgi:2-methylcitrate dehydratase PrpD